MMQTVVDYYNQYDEDTRLSIRHQTEFWVTTYFLDSIIKCKDSILDVAAGTGIYSFYYAQRGCRVEALDIVPKHIDILKAKSSRGLNIEAMVGDARDLKKYSPESFNIVLNMGAIYHIEEKEIPGCINECLRVLKPGGYLALTYLNKYKGFETELKKYGNLFKFYSPFEIEQYFRSQKESIVLHSPTDADFFADFEKHFLQAKNVKNSSFQINELRIEDYHFWLEENLVLPDIQLINEKFIHALLVVKKI